MPGQGMAQVQFCLRAETSLGESIYVLGSTKELGNWHLAGALALTTNAHTYPLWTSAAATLPAMTLDYKYVKVRDGRLIQWEQFEGNRRIELQPSSSPVLLTADVWGIKSAPMVVAAAEVPETPVEVIPTEDSFIAELAALNASHVSWRRKLEVVHSLLSSSSLDDAAVGVVAGYCHFLRSGLIPCEEDGSHYRPSNHAALSRDITQALTALRTPQNSLQIRQILATLPSYQPAFTASVPLTRIRDIAHRNDIPSDFKREIKTTLQNKLHRCAGPEDLVTCENVLAKAETMGLSEEFMREMRLFYSELKEFFNATELQERLQLLSRQMPALQANIERFLGEKERRSPQREEFLTALRRQFSSLQGLEPHEAQSLLMADIELTSFAFSCFSERINALGDLLRPENYTSSSYLMDQLLENLILSHYEPEESGILRRELAVHRAFPVRGAPLLRLKATCERILRLTSEYSDQASAIQPRVNELGRVLRVDRKAVAVFSEGLIRSQLPFQLSKVASMVLRLVKSTGGFSPWLPIYPGKCQGAVLSVREVAQIPAREPVIVIVERAEGDEEVPPNVVGLVVAHDLPQLSHLAVRLRQGKVVSAACDSAEDIASLRRVTGYGELTVTGGEVQVTEATRRERKGEEPPNQVVVSTADISLAKVVVAARAEQPACGGKAYMAGRLEALTRTIPGYCTPKSVCIPFGLYHKFLPSLPQSSRPAALEYMDKQLSAQKGDLEVLSQSIVQLFQGCSGPLIFRSSANVEDTANVAGAGLYDSIANVPGSDVHRVAQAIGEVWKSIATERAWKSREYHRLPHASALMAVLVQELVTPKYAFVVHTQNPFGSAEEAYIELAAGLGETLASGDQRGSPYRLTFHKGTESLAILSLASYSYALLPTPTGVERVRNDYSTEDLGEVEALGVRIGSVSAALERELQCAQDIEGVVAEGQLWIVQSRPQM